MVLTLTDYGIRNGNFFVNPFSSDVISPTAMVRETGVCYSCRAGVALKVHSCNFHIPIHPVFHALEPKAQPP